MKQNPAIEAAIALTRNPGLLGPMRRQSLPSGVTDLLRLLAEDAPIDRRLRDTLEAYVQNVMLFDGASARRVLGVGADAGRPEMRSHLRLLMMWLHPDRNGSAWRAAFAAKVLAAWRSGAEPPGSVARRGQRSRVRPVRLTWVPLALVPAPAIRQRRSRRWLVLAALLALAIAIPSDGPSRLVAVSHATFTPGPAPAAPLAP